MVTMPPTHLWWWLGDGLWHFMPLFYPHCSLCITIWWRLYSYTCLYTNLYRWGLTHDIGMNTIWDISIILTILCGVEVTCLSVTNVDVRIFYVMGEYIRSKLMQLSVRKNCNPNLIDGYKQATNPVVLESSSFIHTIHSLVLSREWWNGGRWDDDS